LETILSLQADGTGTLQASLVKDTMRRKKPQFSERSYGYRTFTDLLREATQLELIQTHQDERSGTLHVDGLAF